MANQNSIYAPTPFAVAKGGTGNTASLTNGQLWIGNTGNVPTPANLTAGTGVTITNGAGTITIAAPASDPSATVLANPTASQTLAPNTTYICTNTSGGITTFTLPTVPVAGDFYRIVGGGSQGWKVAQNATQQVFIGALSTTAGTGGSVNSTTSGGSSNESITIWCQSSTVFLGEIGGGQVNLI
jgi:hypothetical protein